MKIKLVFLILTYFLIPLSLSQLITEKYYNDSDNSINIIFNNSLENYPDSNIILEAWDNNTLYYNESFQIMKLINNPLISFNASDGEYKIKVFISKSGSDLIALGEESIIVDEECKKRCSAMNYYENNYCLNNTYNYFHNFSCENWECNEKISYNYIKPCQGQCIGNQCQTNLSQVRCTNDSDCEDFNIYTIDECNKENSSLSFCKNTIMNCITDNDCGITGFIGTEFCSLNNTYKNFQNSTCINPGTKESFCDIKITPILLNSCGNSYCENWSNYYCKNNTVYHERVCHNRECKDRACFDTLYLEESELDFCYLGCVNGSCISECDNDEDCGSETMELFCKGKEIYKESKIPKCINSSCTKIIKQDFIKKCSQKCTEGKCLFKDHETQCPDLNDSIIEEEIIHFTNITNYSLNKEIDPVDPITTTKENNIIILLILTILIIILIILISYNLIKK